MPDENVDFRKDPLRVDRLQFPEGSVEEAKNLIDTYIRDGSELSREEILEVFSAHLSMMSIDMVTENEKLTFEIVERLLRTIAEDMEKLEKLSEVAKQVVKKNEGDELFNKAAALGNSDPVKEFHVQALLWTAAIRTEEGITDQEIHDHIMTIVYSFEDLREKEKLN